MAAMRKAIVLFASLSVALLAAVIVLLMRPPAGDARGLSTQKALEDPAVKRAVIAELLGSNPAFFDAHPDAAVGRVFSPGLQDVEFRETLVSTNGWGMRERDYELPKPAGVLRVVLLGDSYVFGQGVGADERLGVFLEQELRRRGDFPGEIEVLHLGVGSWNVIAECTFVRRQLSDLAPDLVVQIMVPNDFDDNAGVRGFGVRADFDPLHRQRADARIHFRYPVNFLGAREPNYLTSGLDHESRERARTASEHIVQLAHALQQRGAGYLLLPCVPYPRLISLRSHLDGQLTAEQIAHVHMEQMTTRELFVSEDDPHWNRAGHERMARYLYATIQTRGLLPALTLDPWPEAEREVEALHARVIDELTRYDLPRPEVKSFLANDRQVYGGIDKQGNVSPYASLLLGRGEGGRLELEGACLERPELDGATVRVFVESFELGTFELESGEPIEQAWPLPAELDGIAYVNVRFVADDWVYTGRERRDCKSFHLQRVAIR